jgi:hypothetical protein
MRGQRWFALSCSIAMMFVSFAAKAGGGGTIESGTITFVGAIVAPTCSPSMTVALTAATVAPAQGNVQSQICGGPGGDVANAARAYVQSVTPIASSESDQVLKYFGDYVRAGVGEAANPKLITQTYE